jgi:hypothetical protein
VPALLDVVPDIEGMGGSVYVDDFASAGAAAGIAPLPSDPTPDEIADYLIAVSMGPPVPGSGPPPERDPWMAGYYSRAFGDRYVTASDEWAAEFGFGLQDVEAAVLAGRPPGQITVFVGDFDPGAIETALRADPVWGPELEVVEYGRGSYYRWGGDYEVNPERASAARPLGRGGCLAVRDEVVIRTYGTAEMEAALDTLEGRADSLADVDALRTLAAVLEDEGVYSAHLTLDVASLPAPAGAGADALAPYEALAIGPGVDDDGTAFEMLVLVHGDEAAAAANATRLEEKLNSTVSQRTGQPWSDILGEVEIRLDGVGVTLIARRDGPPRALLDALFTRDGLLLWAPEV